MSSTLALVLLAALASPAADPPRPDPDALAKAIAPLLEERSTVVVHIDLAALDLAALTDTAARLAGVPAKELAPAREEMRARLEAFRNAGGRDAYAVFSLADFPDQPYLVVPIPEGTEARPLLDLLGRAQGVTVEQVGRAIFYGGRATLERLRRHKPSAHPDLAKAFAAAGPSIAQAVLLPAADVRRTLEEVMPTLPADLGGGPVTDFTRGLRWAALGVQTKPAEARLVIQAADEASARALHAALGRLLKGLAGQKWLREGAPNAERLAALLAPEIHDSRLTLTLDEKALTAAVRPIAEAILGRSRERQTDRGLMRLLQAMHDYHTRHGHFPAAAAYDKEGKPLLSWRVQLLPFLGEQKLYEQFRLDEPWDGEHNGKLIAKMPAVFAAGEAALAAAGKTPYLAPRGPATMFPDGKGLRIADVPDGVSSTIFLVLADDAHAVAWTRPDDLPFDPKAPQRGLAVGRKGEMWVGMVDGSVRRLPKDVEHDRLRALFTRNGGEPAE